MRTGSGNPSRSPGPLRMDSIRAAKQAYAQEQVKGSDNKTCSLRGSLRSGAAVQPKRSGSWVSCLLFRHCMMSVLSSFFGVVKKEPSLKSASLVHPRMPPSTKVPSVTQWCLVQPAVRKAGGLAGAGLPRRLVGSLCDDSMCVSPSARWLWSLTSWTYSGVSALWPPM